MDMGGVSFFFLPELAWDKAVEVIRSNRKKPANLLVVIVGTRLRESASFLHSSRFRGIRVGQ